MKKITDKQRLDWVEKQTNNQWWMARQSVIGRGFRLHNMASCDAGWDQNLVATTAREAIDLAMNKEHNAVSKLCK